MADKDTSSLHWLLAATIKLGGAAWRSMLGSTLEERPTGSCCPLIKGLNHALLPRIIENSSSINHGCSLLSNTKDVNLLGGAMGPYAW